MAMSSEPMQSQNPIAIEIMSIGEAADVVGMNSPGVSPSLNQTTVGGGDEIAESSCSSSFGNVSFGNVETVVRPWLDAFEVVVGDNAAKNLAYNVMFDDPLMDANTWPVLSKSTRASLKSSSSDSNSLRTVADGSISAAQVTGLASPSHNPNSTPTPNHVQVTGLGSNSNHVPYNRQKSMRRGVGNLVEHPSPHGIGGLGSIPNSGNEQQSHSFKRVNGGPHPRGNASRYHHSGGKRVDQDRRNHHDWNFNSNFGDKDTNLQRVPTGSFQGPPFPVSGQFILPNMPGRPLVGPFIYHDGPAPVYSAPVYSAPGPYPYPYPAAPGAYPDLYRAFHPMAPVAPVINPPHVDPELNAKILHQIEYYFSNDNLASTTHLRENMDAQGWVSIKLIAGFKKVMQLTYNIQLILDVLKVSTVVEVEAEKVRRRNDWKKWLLPPSFSESTLSSSGSSEDMLSANLQRTVLHDVPVKHGTSEGIYRPSS